jgi:hypothetical protein
LHEENKFKGFVVNSHVKSYRFRNNLFILADKLRTHKLEAVPAFADKNVFADIKYSKNGYLASDKVVTKDALQNSPFKIKEKYVFNQKQLDYFEKTINLCKSKNIKLLAVTAPMPNTTIDYITSYNTHSKAIYEFSQKRGAEYIDYNLINNRDTLFDDSCFRDSNHLNSKGATTLSNLLADVIVNKL